MERDNNADQISPGVVEEQIRAHDAMMRDGRGQWALYKSTYMTKYWEHMGASAA